MSFRLKPRDDKFFKYFNDLADAICEASMILKSFVENRSDPATNLEKINEVEERGDIVLSEVMKRINNSFITPFDREDIQHLANRLDDVTDGINSSAKRIALYNPKEMPPESVEMAKLIKESALAVSKAVDQLHVLKKSPTKIKKYCAELHELENKADDVYDQFIIKLFETEEDAIEVVKLKEIMYELEKTTDGAELVGKIIKTIIVKYA